MFLGQTFQIKPLQPAAHKKFLKMLMNAGICRLSRKEHNRPPVVKRAILAQIQKYLSEKTGAKVVFFFELRLDEINRIIVRLWQKKAVKTKGLLLHLDGGEFVPFGLARVLPDQCEQRAGKLAKKAVKK